MTNTYESPKSDAAFDALADAYLERGLSRFATFGQYLANPERYNLMADQADRAAALSSANFYVHPDPEKAGLPSWYTGKGSEVTL